MDILQTVIFIGMIVFATHALEAITGFGCTALALPFVAMVLGIKAAVPVLASLSWFLTIFIVIRSRKSIYWKEYFFIAFHVILGLPIGMCFFRYFPPHILKGLLAIFMIGVGINGLRKNLRPKQEKPLLCHSTHQKTCIMRFFLFCGGVMHGAFASGGPFVVIYASKVLADKSLFRVSLCLIWLTMNTLLLMQWTVLGGVWTKTIGICIATAIPFSIVGALFGDYLHHKVDEQRFSLIVYGVLVLCGTIIGVDIVQSFLIR